jgi:hypothetical protein
LNYIPKTLDLDIITMGDNPRLPTTLDIPPLKRNISEVGLLEPITVWFPNGKEIAEVIRGHRRTIALNQLKDEDPKRFKELFPKGIPAFVRENITEEEVVTLKLDHGGQKGLSHPHELQMSASMMFDKGFTEAQVANQLRPLIDKISPMPSSKRVEVGELESKLAEARASGKAKAIESAEKALYERIAKYHRGRVQYHHDVWRSPYLVEAALYFKACGVVKKGFEKEYLPNLTTSHVKALWKAHKEDLEQKEDGAPKYNKTRVGPLFTEKWNAIVKAEKEKGENPTQSKPKAMSAKDMLAEVKEGKWESKGFCKLALYHAGDKSVEGLSALDKAYKAADLVMSAEDTSLWEMVVTEAKNIEAALIAKDAEAAKTAEAAEAADKV